MNHGRTTRHSWKAAGGLLFCAVLSTLAGTYHVPQKYQEKTEWCWSGCSQAILEYHGVVVTQTNIALYGTGGANTWNYLWGEGSHDGVYCRGIREILSNFGGFWSYGTSASLPLSTVSNETAACRPFVINWLWDGGGGHFVVHRGMDNNQMYLMDPWYGPTINTYDWVCRGNGHTWSYSLRLTNNPVYPAEISAYGAGMAVAGQRIQIQWNSVSNKFYRLEQCSNLLSGAWTLIQSNLPASWPQNTATVDVSTAESGALRIRWEP